jgi:hypothetical protein
VPPRPQENPEKSPAQIIHRRRSRASVREDSKRLSPNRLRSRINEAERLMKAHPVPTAMTPSLEYCDGGGFAARNFTDSSDPD